MRSIQTYEIDFSVIISWQDMRLSFQQYHPSWMSGTFQLVNLNDQAMLWHPTLFIVNAEKVLTPEVLQQNSVNFVLSDGTVLHQQRYLQFAQSSIRYFLLSAPFKSFSYCQLSHETTIVSIWYSRMSFAHISLRIFCLPTISYLELSTSFKTSRCWWCRHSCSSSRF